MAGCHSFCLFSYFIHTFIQSQYIYLSPFAEASLHFLIACMLSGENFLVVPSRVLNSGLHYSKRMRWQLGHVAPYLSLAAPFWATPYHAKSIYQIFQLFSFLRLVFKRFAILYNLIIYISPFSKELIKQKMHGGKQITEGWLAYQFSVPEMDIYKLGIKLRIGHQHKAGIGI